MTVGSTPINDSISNASAEWKEIVSDQRIPEDPILTRIGFICYAPLSRKN
jgi:hypothetical protein